jgi:hypothetical protein
MNSLSIEWIRHDPETGYIAGTINWGIQKEKEYSAYTAGATHIFLAENLSQDDVLASSSWINWDDSRPDWWSVVLFVQSDGVSVHIISTEVSPE